MLHTTFQSLSEFSGQTAVIHRLELPDDESLRLKSLGVFEGQSVSSIQRTGSAIIMTAAGARLAISDTIARQIVVSREQAA